MQNMSTDESVLPVEYPVIYNNAFIVSLKALFCVVPLPHMVNYKANVDNFA